MADFFKSLTSGFGTGLQISQAMRDREERDRLLQQRQELQAAYGLTPQEESREATLARAQAETQALAQRDAIDFGLTPQDMQSYAPAAPVMPAGGQSIGVPTYTIGGQTFRRQPTEFDIDAARTRAAADVYGKYGDTARRQELLTGLRREERAIADEKRRQEEALRSAARETRDQAAFVTQQQEVRYRLDALAETAAERKNLRAFEDRLNTIANPSTDDVTKLSKEFNLSGATKDAVLSRFITGRGLVRGEEAAARMQAFNQWQVQNPNAGFPEIAAETRRLGMSIDEQYNIASKITGIDKASFEASEMRIRKLVQGKNLDGLLKAHKESDDLDPGTHFEVIRGKGGTLTLNRVDSKTGTVVQPNVFSGTEAEATTYLNRAATDPSTIVDFTMNLEKGKAAIRASQASTQASQASARASDATTGLRSAQAAALAKDENTRAERTAIMEAYDKLTPEQQKGPEGDALMRRFNMVNVKLGGTVPLGSTAKAGRQYEMTDLDKENLKYYREWEKDPRNAKLPQATKDAKAADLGITQFIKRNTEGPSSGFGSNPYAASQDGTAAAPATTGLTTAPARAQAPALTSENTKILSAAGNTGYNVQLPDGSTRVMSISQLEQMGYKFPSGTGLQRPWYADLLPGR